MNSAAAHVTVVGGGLAGMSAAVALAPRGYRVTLIEKRPALGGRAGSLLDAASGEWIDNCQHILMPCCTNLLDFYRKIGVERRIRFHPEIPFLDSRGRLSRLYSSPLPAPLHCLPSFFALRFLSLRDKWRIAAGLRALRHLAEADESDGRSFLEWLRGKGQSARALAEFWQPVIVSALNEEPARVSAALAAKVFLEAFLSHPKGWWMGIPTVPLGLLYQEPAAGFLRSCGSEVLLRSDVLAVERLDGNRWAVQLRDGPRIDSDKIVLAVPWHALPPLLSGSVRISMMLPPVENLKASPITGVHVWFDRPVTDLSFAALPGKQVHWLFNKSGSYELRDDRICYLQLVRSASRSWTELGKNEILDIALGDLRQVLPQARAAVVRQARVFKEPLATFSPDPKSDTLRPDSRTGAANAYLAGDWTRTGWPSTMEGAVRSGYLAAEAVLADDGRSERIMVPDLPPSGFMRRAGS